MPILLTLLLTVIFASSGAAQSVTAGNITAETSEVVAEITALRNDIQQRIDTIAAFRTRVSTCGDKQRLYNPAGRGVDGDGCALISEMDALAADFAKDGVIVCGTEQFLFPETADTFVCVSIEELRERIAQ